MFWLWGLEFKVLGCFGFGVWGSCAGSYKGSAGLDEAAERVSVECCKGFRGALKNHGLLPASMRFKTLYCLMCSDSRHLYSPKNAFLHSLLTLNPKP